MARPNASVHYFLFCAQKASAEPTMPLVDQQTWLSLSPISTFGKALTGPLSRLAASPSQESSCAITLRERRSVE
jgi:hypothetical protein